MHGIVYKLTKGTQCYIGSTVRALHERLYSHKCSKTHNCTSRVFEGVYTAEILDEFEFEHLSTLRLRELWFIDTIPCINNDRPMIYKGMGKVKKTTQELHAIYYKKHSEKIKQRARDFQAQKGVQYGRARNARTKIECPCGGCYPQRNKKLHSKTKRHQSYLATLT